MQVRLSHLPKNISTASELVQLKAGCASGTQTATHNIVRQLLSSRKIRGWASGAAVAGGAQGAGMLAAGNLKDLWMPLLCMTLLLISAIYGLVDLLTGATLRRCPSPPRWVIYRRYPQYLGLAGVPTDILKLHLIVHIGMAQEVVPAPRVALMP